MLRESYVKVLNEQRFSNSDNAVTKINIHLPVKGEINDFVIKSNKRIIKTTQSEINFSPMSFQLPHITLAMGFIRSINDYDNICNKLSVFVKQLPNLNLTFEHPYIKRPDNKYIFIDVNPADQIIELKKELYSLIKPDFETVKWDILNEPPHITIGYIGEKQNIVEREFYPIPKVSMRVDQINLSFSGYRGSVLGVIREFGK